MLKYNWLDFCYLYTEIMKDTIENPHDKLFKTVFSDPEDTASFLRAYLPESVVERIDWKSLNLLP